MKKIIAIAVAISIPFAAANACTAFFKYESQQGMNKICYYDHLGSKVAYNVRSHELCPLTIQVRH